MEVIDQVVSIYAGTNGGLDECPIGAVKKFEGEWLAYVRSRHADVRTRIEKNKDIGDEDRTALKAALDDFKKTFTP